MITLAGRSFSGPFLVPLWSAPRAPGIYAVMVPGWRLLTFRALHFGEAEKLSVESLRAHPRHAEWITVAGTEWNLYVATHELSFSTASQREAVLSDVMRQYQPEPGPADPNPELPGLRALLLARAMRTNQD